MSLQKTPLGCKEIPFCSEPVWGLLHGVAQHHGFMQGQSEPLWGSLICIMLHHRNMQISTSGELMHRERIADVSPDLISEVYTSLEAFLQS